jgi:hypothetical protein
VTRLPAAAVRAIDAIAKARGISRAEALSIAVGFLQAADMAAADGFYVGAVRHRDELVQVIAPRAVSKARR